MASTSRLLVVVAGPTGSGKTAAAVALAQHFQTEVVSADSRQFYHEMQVGTARPLPVELAGVPHHFLGHLPVTQEYHAGQYATDALALLDSLFQKYPVAIMVGGSGLYIKAVTEGLDELPAVPAELRQALAEELRQGGLEPLVNRLRDLDPDYAASADLNNPSRVLRALEVCQVSGKPFSSFRTGQPQARPFTTVGLLLDPPRQELYDRLDQRMDAMLANGLLAEATALYPQRHLRALQTLGYTEIFDFLDGKTDWPTTVELLKRNNRRYAKRQLTYFRNQMQLHPVQPTDITGMITLVEETMDSLSQKPG